MVFQKPRGTADWIDLENKKINRIYDILKAISNLYVINQIDTPTFEHLDLFLKSVGQTSDIVNKELYNFTDKGNRNLALRPEGTASVIRAYVENKMYANNNDVTKLFYLFNLFRYERPQSGRMREFHQYGVEFLNVKSFLSDVEILLLANDILNIFNLSDNVILKINNLGSFKQRELWINELKQYFSKFKSELSEDSLNRLDKNPLRILDDKVDSQKEFVKNAPKLSSFLSKEDQNYFNNIINTLDTLKIKYEIDYNLVRGLDYYTGLVFEFVSLDNDLIGKSTIIGGGRYSNLIKQTGGPDYEGIGFAIGIERLLMLLNKYNYDFKLDNFIDVYIGCENSISSIIGITLANKLRNLGFKTNIEYEVFKKDKNFKNAIKQNAKYFIWINKDSINSQNILVENLANNEHQIINLKDISIFLNK